jgi:hypothetical protein
MRKLAPSFWLLLVLGSGTAGQTPPPNPLFRPSEGDSFGSAFFTAPNSNTLPNGTEVPPPPPEALLGPGCSLRQERFWLSADFLYAASSRTVLPPLVTTSPVGSDPAVAGVLGRNTTLLAFGGNQLSELRPAVRADVGVWVCDRFALDGSFHTLFEAKESFVATSNPGGTILGRPVVTGGETAVLIGADGQPGTVRAAADTFVIGGDANLRMNVGRTQFGRWDVFAGYRYQQLRDGVRVATERFVQGQEGGPDLRVLETDQFRTRNEFHGPQVGIGTSHRLFDRLTFSSRLAVAMGVTLADTRLAGSTTSALGTSASGLLVTATNAGRYEHAFFAVMPTAEGRLGYDVTDWLRFSVGYTFLYWSRVERAGDQIDRTIAGPGRPGYPHRTTDYWLQGVSLGAEVRY